MGDSILAAGRRLVVRRYRVADNTQAEIHTEADTHNHRDRHAIPDGRNYLAGYPVHGHRHDLRTPTL